MRLKNKKKYSLAPPIDYWFFVSLFLAIILLVFSFFLIKERLFLQEMNLLLEKYKITLNSFSGLNSKLVNSHLSQPTNPSSSTGILYLKPENFSLR